ncbi:hypothetical protein H5410_006712 [Solanum commersonii]|uniref:Uncharacterized protein n=1 Tax=Solanum commersonii TaxID=4109 RepID=A0A9J6A9W1_SOLCO|nr:hypothetical protein H5410_006712 [Solanum commersonii]
MVLANYVPQIIPQNLEISYFRKKICRKILRKQSPSKISRTIQFSYPSVQCIGFISYKKKPKCSCLARRLDAFPSPDWVQDTCPLRHLRFNKKLFNDLEELTATWL